MKLLHCADLHLGKRLGCFDLLPDQRIILQEILSIAADAKVQAILLAGDVYDKPDPPAAAMAVFSDFAARLHEAGHRPVSHQRQSRQQPQAFVFFAAAGPLPGLFCRGIHRARPGAIHYAMRTAPSCCICCRFCGQLPSGAFSQARQSGHMKTPSGRAGSDAPGAGGAPCAAVPPVHHRSGDLRF